MLICLLGSLVDKNFKEKEKYVLNYKYYYIVEYLT